MHRLLLIALSLVGPALLLSSPAVACGGFFCSTDPIVQTDEQIVFAVDESSGTIETHVQIGYQGAAEDFSWVIPVPGVPDLDLGSDELFRQLLWSTATAYELEVGEADCRDPWVWGGWMDDDLDADRDGAGGVDPGEVQVLSESVVGSYQATVVTATAAEPLLDWFNCNGYRIAFNSVDKVEQYLSGGMNFLALKLVNGAETGMLVPIVMTYESAMPMVPLVLTAVASRANLGVRVWVLGSDRAVPVGYDHLWINEARMRWPSYSWWWGIGDPAYTDLVSHAVDEAGGHAFVTDYSGPVDFMDRLIYWDGRYDLEELTTYTDPADFVERALMIGLPRNAVMQAILRRHIPMPDEVAAQGVTERQFYTPWGLRQWSSFLEPFDVAAAVADIDTLVVQPMQVSQALFDDSGSTVMTRLYTTLSPWEMDTDPMFTFIETPIERLPYVSDYPHGGKVPSLRQARLDFIGGDLNTACWEQSIGQVVRTSTSVDQVLVQPTGSGGAGFPTDMPNCQDLPAALAVERWSVDGSVQLVTDNRGVQDTLAPDGLCSWAEVPPASVEPPVDWDNEPPLMPAEEVDPEVCAAFGDAGLGVGANELGGGGFPQDSVGDGTEWLGGPAGCRTDGAATAGGLLFLPLMLLGLRRRNRALGVSLCFVGVVGLSACVSAGAGDRIAAHEIPGDLDQASVAATMSELGVSGMVWMPVATATIEELVGEQSYSLATVRGTETDMMQQVEDAVAKGALGVKLALGGNSQSLAGQGVAELVADCAENDMPLVLEIDIKPANRQFLVEDLLQAWPEETFVLAHWGGLAAQLDRLESLLRRHPNLVLDISLGADPEPFLKLVERDPAAYAGFFLRRSERLIWGGGFRYTSGMDPAVRMAVDFDLYERDQVEYKGGAYPGLMLPPEVTERIFGQNARRVYGL